LTDPTGVRDEIAEKSRWWTSATVNAAIERTFAPEERAAAACELARLAPSPECAEEADVTACRLMLAAVRVSEGDLLKLAMWIEAGRSDPRDLIAAAEYPQQLMDMSTVSGNRDLDDYIAWVSGARSA